MGETLKWYKAQHNFDEDDKSTLFFQLLYNPDPKSIKEHIGLSAVLDVLQRTLAAKHEGAKFSRGESVNQSYEEKSAPLRFFNQYADNATQGGNWHMPFLQFLRACDFSEDSIRFSLNTECKFPREDKDRLNAAAEALRMREIFVD